MKNNFINNSNIGNSKVLGVSGTSGEMYPQGLMDRSGHRIVPPTVKALIDGDWVDTESAEYKMRSKVEEYYHDVEEKNTMPIESKVLEYNKPVGNLNAAPVNIRSQVYNSSPSFLESGPGSIKISHRELVCSVTGTANTETFPINLRIQPSNSESFPWLSNIASMFETYTFTHLRYIFVPRVATNAVGQIGLALDFDADDQPASTLANFSQYRHSVIGSIWGGVEIQIPQEMMQICVKERYTDHEVAEHAYDPLLHDLGHLRVAVLTPADSVIVGQIYVEYVVVLRTPEPANDKEAETLIKYTPTTATLNYCFGTVAASEPALTTVVKDNIGIGWIYNGTCWLLQLPLSGYYMVWVRAQTTYEGTEWDTGAKAQANIASSIGIAGYSGVTLYSAYPVSGELCPEVRWDTTTKVFYDYCLVVKVTDPARSGWRFTYTANASAGVPATKALTSYQWLRIVRLRDTTVLPAIDDNSPARKLGLSPSQYRSYSGIVYGTMSKLLPPLVDFAKAKAAQYLRGPGVGKSKVKKNKSRQSKGKRSKGQK